MKQIAILFLLSVCIASAEPLPYFEMKQYITNVEDKASNYFPQGIAVTGLLLTNGMAEAITMMNSLASDPDYFGDDIAFDAYIHWHDHFNPSACRLEFVGSHRSKKDALTKYMALIEDVDNPSRFIPESWILAIDNKKDANRKEAKIKASHGDKKWKRRKDHGVPQ
jgi:hypothetical protein